MSNNFLPTQIPLNYHIILGSGDNDFDYPVPSGVVFCKAQDEIIRAINHSERKRTIFISYSEDYTNTLLAETIKLDASAYFRQLLTIHHIHLTTVPPLQGIFESVIGFVDGYQWLPKEELVAAITSKDAPYRFIGGVVDPNTQTITLVKGNYTSLVVPFSFFQETGNKVRPDFAKLSFDDYGHTVVLGNYEASADAILYETDSGYRKQINKDRKKNEKSFGASLRRLRIQKRLTRADFYPITEKTIARIERNEIAKPQSKTLTTIAKRLNVSPEQIETY